MQKYNNYSLVTGMFRNHSYDTLFPQIIPPWNYYLQHQHLHKN